jgi:hypothetical protein
MTNAGGMCTIPTLSVINFFDLNNERRITSMSAPLFDFYAANTKYVDDKDSATRTYVDAKDAATRNYSNNAVTALSTETMTEVDVLSTQASQVVTFLVAEMAEEEIRFRPVADEASNLKTCTLQQEIPLYFTLPALLQQHTDLITEVHLVFSFRKTKGIIFLEGRNTTSLTFDMTGTTLTVTETYYAESVSTLALGEILNAKVSLRATVASKVLRWHPPR